MRSELRFWNRESVERVDISIRRCASVCKVRAWLLAPSADLSFFTFFGRLGMPHRLMTLWKTRASLAHLLTRPLFAIVAGSTMTLRDIALQRLVNQQIAGSTCASPAEVVARMGAMQAQDYLGALWSVGLRSPGATEASVEEALARREIIRTWPMRGTLHFVAARDARWMLELLTPRIIAGSASRHRELELNENIFARSEKLFRQALAGGQHRTREDLMSLLDAAGIATANQRGYHILGRLAMERVLCFGPRAGKQQTFVLFDDWIPGSRSLPREKALEELALRYFTGHGPATLADFAWWSGLKIIDARAGLESVKAQLIDDELDGTTYWRPPTPTPSLTRSAFLLPGFDELLLGYKDRDATLDPQHAPRIVPGKNGMFLPTLVKGGRVVGTWKRLLKKSPAVVTAETFDPLSASEAGQFSALAKQYGRFIGVAEVAFSA